MQQSNLVITSMSVISSDKTYLCSSHDSWSGW